MDSRQASVRELEAYTTGVPARFHRPPLSSAPLPERSSAVNSLVSGAMRHSVTYAVAVVLTRMPRTASARSALLRSRDPPRYPSTSPALGRRVRAAGD